MHALWAAESEADIALDDVSLSAPCFEQGDLLSTHTQATSLLHPCQDANYCLCIKRLCSYEVEKNTILRVVYYVQEFISLELIYADWPRS